MTSKKARRDAGRRIKEREKSPPLVKTPAPTSLAAESASSAAVLRAARPGAMLTLWDRLHPHSRNWDYVALGCLTIYVAGLLFPFIHVPLLDVDEAEFMASAAYLHFQGDSALAWPNHTYVVAAYKWVADWVGPYDLFPLRVATFAIGVAVAGLVYTWLAAATSRWIALFCAIFLMISGMFHNACLVSREWPCVLALLGGGYLFLCSQDAQGTKRRRLIFAAGFATGLALFFKEQAAYITQAIPIWLLIQAIAQRNWRSRLAEALAYAAGGLTAGAIYFMPFVLRGALQSHLAAELEFGSAYAYASSSEAGILAPSTTNWFRQFFFDRQNSAFILVAYFASFSQLPRLAQRLWRGDRAKSPSSLQIGDDRDHQAILLLTCYLLTSSAAVAMGSRFFVGYFLLWLPFVAILGGYGLKLLLLDSPTWVTWMSLVPVVYVVVRFPGIFNNYETVFAPLVILLIAAARNRDRPLLWRLRWAPQLMLFTVLLALQASSAFVMNDPLRLKEAGWSVLRPSETTRAFFQKHAKPADRMFVWGGEPSYYCVTRLEPASRFVCCGGTAFLGDYFHPTAVSPAWAAELFRDLDASPPRFVLVEPTQGDTMKMSGRMYSLDLFPALAARLAADYRRVATLDDCDVYERR